MSKSNPSEFKQITITKLSKQAGERCSLCGLGTSKPHSDISEFINLGEAAHVKGEKKAKNNRFDKDMSDEDRANIRNGIWLCRRCHKIIYVRLLPYICTNLVRS